MAKTGCYSGLFCAVLIEKQSDIIIRCSMFTYNYRIFERFDRKVVSLFWPMRIPPGDRTITAMNCGAARPGSGFPQSPHIPLPPLLWRISRP
jgi:hypothetical protein